MQRWRTRRKGTARQTGPAYVPCGDCSQGWVTVGKTGATRCWCWRRWRMQLEPEPAQPIRLPSPVSDL